MYCADGLIKAGDDGKYCGKVTAVAALIERTKRAKMASILVVIVAENLLVCFTFLNMLSSDDIDDGL